MYRKSTKMAIFYLLVLATLVLQVKAEDSLVLDNNQFLIYNKVYHKARLTQFDTGYFDVGTYEHELNPDQLWTLEPHPNKEGCYYIINERYPQWRIANSKHKFVVFNGPYYEDQLFRFVPSGKNDGFYYITNCLHTNDRIAKYGVANDKVSMFGGRKYPDQLWKLVPRFKASFYTNLVFQFDNRQGSSPITKTVSITTGIRKSTTSTVSNKVSYKQSIESSMSAAFKMFNFGATSTMEFSTELEKTFSETYEENWSKTDEIKFVIPAGKNYRVMQHAVDFESPLSIDSCTLLTKIKIFESTGEHFEDPDEFFIDYEQ